MRRAQLAAFWVAMVAIFSATCLAESPKPQARSNDKLEVGKHYCVVIKEIEGDEAVTTTYWATVANTDGERIVLADGEWNQYTGPAVKPRSAVIINKVFSWVYPAGVRKNVGIARGTPMGDDTVTLMRGQISEARPMSEAEFRMRKEAHRVEHPRPPHASDGSAG
jgi:hypothetical protein